MGVAKRGWRFRCGFRMNFETSMSRSLHVRYRKRGAVLLVLANTGLGILITAQFVSKGLRVHGGVYLWGIKENGGLDKG